MTTSDLWLLIVGQLIAVGMLTLGMLIGVSLTLRKDSRYDDEHDKNGTAANDSYRQWLDLHDRLR